MTSTISARAAIVRSSGGKMSLESIDVAPPRADEVRVRMVGVGICHTDIVCRDGFPVPMPIVLGHEGSGIVESVGSSVRSVKPGDAVVLSFNACGHCHNCEHEAPAYCHQFMPLNFGGARADGSSPLSQNGSVVHGNFFGQSSFASYAIVRESNVVKVDASLPLPLLGPLGCGIQTGAGAALNSLGIGPGLSLAIFGGGAVGLSALLAAKAVDAAQVIVVEPLAARRELALSLGADAVIDPRAPDRDALTQLREVSGGGVHRALDTTGIPAVIATAADALLPNGMLGLVGVSPMEATLPVNIMSMIMRGIGIKAILEGDSQPQQFIPRLLALYQQGRFPFDKLISTFPFDQIDAAFHATESGAAIKPVLLF